MGKLLNFAEGKNIKQIVGIAGKGELLDDSDCSRELREFLREVSAEKIYEYVDYCLEAKNFDKKGFVLQDLVNEIGHRLEFKVEPGRYIGKRDGIGFDGIWAVPSGEVAFVIEVKTSDSYTIPLDTPATYKEKLLQDVRVPLDTFVLIVMGRDQTGELEAQIRGSRHAWDMRLLGVRALCNLLKIKLKSEESDTIRRIHNLFIPVEYTRLDNMIDLVFTAAEDFAKSDEPLEAEVRDAADQSKSPAAKKSSRNQTSQSEVDRARDAAIKAFGNQEKITFIQRRRSLFWDASEKHRVVATVSRRYDKRDTFKYWYAYRVSADNFLKEDKHGHLILALADSTKSYAIPRSVITEYIEQEWLNTSPSKGEPVYWHIHLFDTEEGEMMWNLTKVRKQVSIEKYLIK